MKVLVLGGTGFVGRHAAAALRGRGHTVVIGTRNPKRALAKLPPALRDVDLREIHLESLTTRYVWRPVLRDVSAVVNAAGILRERGGETYDRVHHMAPAALALACERMGVRLVQLSLLGLRPESRNRFLRSKLLGERVITETRADYSLVRPSLLDGADGCSAAWLRRDNLPRENLLQALIGRAPAPVGGRNLPAPRPVCAPELTFVGRIRELLH